MLVITCPSLFRNLLFKKGDAIGISKIDPGLYLLFSGANTQQLLKNNALVTALRHLLIIHTERKE